jgi:hypothetical protein
MDKLVVVVITSDETLKTPISPVKVLYETAEGIRVMQAAMGRILLALAFRYVAPGPGKMPGVAAIALVALPRIKVWLADGLKTK